MIELVLERRFAAAPTRVFDFVTKTEHLMAWWGPEGMRVVDGTMDFTRTGPWVAVLEGGEGKRYKVSGKVTEVSPGQFVRFSWGWHDETDARGDETRVEFRIAADESGGTILTLTHSGFTTEESMGGHRQGWESSLRSLESYFST